MGGWEFFIAGAILSIATTAYTTNQTKSAASKTRKSQEMAAKMSSDAAQAAAGQSAAATQAARAATPGAAKAASYSTAGSELSRLRGIQSTLMASRSAQNGGSGGKTTLGE